MERPYGQALEVQRIYSTGKKADANTNCTGVIPGDHTPIVKPNAANANSLVIGRHGAKCRNHVICRLAKLRVRVCIRLIVAGRSARPSRHANTSLYPIAWLASRLGGWGS